MSLVAFVDVPAVNSAKAISTYHVGQRVLFTATFNNPGHERPGDKIPGTVLSVFGDPSIYRIELDSVWKDYIPGLAGKKMIVGNVYEGSIAPLE